MLSRFLTLFQRYTLVHRKLTAPGFDIESIDAQRIGRVEKIHLHGTNIEFEGWTLADFVQICSDLEEDFTRPSHYRHDLQSQLGHDRPLGFKAKLAYGSGVFEMVLSSPNHPIETKTIIPFTKTAWRIEKLRLLRGFTWRTVVLAPSIVKWFLLKSSRSRQNVKNKLGISDTVSRHVLSSQIWHGDADNAKGAVSAAVTIILPVYNAFDDLRECLDRILSLIHI